MKHNNTIQYTTQLFTYLFLSFLPNYLFFASYFLFPSSTFSLSPSTPSSTTPFTVFMCICVFFLFNSLPQILSFFLSVVPFVQRAGISFLYLIIHEWIVSCIFMMWTWTKKNIKKKKQQQQKYEKRLVPRKGAWKIKKRMLS